MTVFSDYYKSELRVLREHAADFASAHPALAGLLEGPAADPDVERLLEGVAFLAADIRRTLDQDFPEILQALAQTVSPNLLRPLPSATVIAFSPKANLKQTQVVAAGTHLESVPVEGYPCRFRTTLDTPVTPLRLIGADRPDLLTDEIPAPDDLVQVRLTLSAGDAGLANLTVPSLRLHLNGDFADTADLYMLLTHYLRGARLIERDTGRVIDLSPDAVRTMGFARDQELLPRPRNMLPAFGVLQDYFLFPDKFLFLEIDLGAWRDRPQTRDASFELVFSCVSPPYPVPEISTERFVLHAVPAVNLFATEAEPVVMDHRDSEYLLRPTGREGSSLSVYSVDKVEGIARGATGRRSYQPFSTFMAGRTDTPVYHLNRRRRRAGERVEVYLSAALPKQQPLDQREVLRAWLTCSNGERAEALLPHDIETPTRDTPELVTFTNLTTPTPGRQPALGEGLLWHLIAHLSLNYLSIAEVDNLKALLRHYAIPGGEVRGRDQPNLKRIESLASIDVRPDERLLGDTFVRGQAIRIKLRHSHFGSDGDRYLFGSVLNHLFASMSPLNTFTALSFEDAASGECLEWPPMLGTQRLF